MAFEINDEKLVAYLLGELEESEREVIEKALSSDEALQQRAAELRATAKLAAEALQAEPAHALKAGQRQAIMSKAEGTPEERPKASAVRVQRRIRRRLRVRWAVAAAAVAVFVVGGIFATLMLTPYGAYEKAAMVASPDEASRPVEDRATTIPFFAQGDVAADGRLSLDADADGIPDVALVPLESQGLGGQGMGGYGGGYYYARLFGERRGEISQEEKTAADATLAILEASQSDRYLIKNAGLVIETEDARKASEQLVASVQALGGYVSDFRESVNALGQRSIQVQVRVPADKFDTTMARLETIGKVLNRHVTTEDVTEQYVDTDARLRNLKRTEERLVAHLDRTGELKGIVEVERELNRVREEIERLEGRVRFLSHRVEFSTFSVTLQERPKAEPVVPPETFSIARIASQATRTLLGFFQNLSKCVVWLGIWAVVWVPLLVLVVFLVRRGIRQFRAARK